MSIDWPYKEEDINDIIRNLERELTQKDLDIKDKNKIINELIKVSEEHKNKYRESKAKLEYAEEEINKLKSDFKKKKLKLDFLKKEIEELKEKVKLKEQKISQFNLENNKLIEKIYHLESHIQKLKHLSQDYFLKQIKEILSLKGFLSEKQFKELIKNKS